MDIQSMLEEATARNRARGLDVRCPTCDAGRGKFCLKAGHTQHVSADDIDVHPARVALAREQGFIA